MRLFTKLFLNTLLAIVVAEAVLLVVASILPSREFESDLEAFRTLSEPARRELFTELSRDSRRGLVEGILVSLPVATAVAAVVTLRESRRVGRGVRRLAEVSDAVSRGQFGEQVTVSGRDELSDLTHNFNAMTEALAHAQRDRSDLVSTVTHELRTPLAALQGYSEALSDGVLPAETAAQAIDREVASLRKIVVDLTLVSSAEAGTLLVHPTRLNVATLVDDAEDRFKGAFEAGSVSFCSVVQVGLPDLEADRERVGQVLANLLGNALKYTPAGGAVTLRAERTPEPGSEYVLISASDTGPGISAEHHAHIFERFYRVDASRGRSAGGLGVGLTVSKTLVEAMGGTIYLKSEPGAGTTFFFTLPEARN